MNGTGVIQNTVRDWNKLQGISSPTDHSFQIRRELGSRYVSIQNSSARPISVAITTYYSGPTPVKQMTFKPGEIKSIGINGYGDPMQFIYILDPQNGKILGQPYAFRTDANTFVLRDGENKWWVDTFRFSPFRAQH
jgi:hypothetical protein